MANYLVTGGAGFIGSNFIRHLIEHEPTAHITNLDALTYAGVSATVRELDERSQHEFVRGDILDTDLVDAVMRDQDVVVHFAAETHVDRSIADSAPFLSTNVLGTGVLLDAARRHDVDTFIHISTDEVYGSVTEGIAAETAPLEPSSPYASSKAGADLLALSHHVTYGTNVIVTRCTNNYGPYQYPEKLIPLFATNLIDGHPVPLYGEGRNERDWLHVEDHCSAIYLLIHKGNPGEVYNIGANAQLPNKSVAKAILAAFHLDESWIEHVTDRPGHDFRYAVDSKKIRSLGWAPAHRFEERLDETIEWYRNREDWWRPLRSHTS